MWSRRVDAGVELLEHRLDARVELALVEKTPSRRGYRVPMATFSATVRSGKLPSSWWTNASPSRWAMMRRIPAGTGAVAVISSSPASGFSTPARS